LTIKSILIESLNIKEARYFQHIYKKTSSISIRIHGITDSRFAERVTITRLRVHHYNLKYSSFRKNFIDVRLILRAIVDNLCKTRLALMSDLRWPY